MQDKLADFDDEEFKERLRKSRQALEHVTRRHSDRAATSCRPVKGALRGLTNSF